MKRAKRKANAKKSTRQKEAVGVLPLGTFDQIPNELHVSILTYLRAYDLSALHQTCRYFASKILVQAVIKYTVEHVYPSELLEGFELEGREYSFETLRDIEWLVIARVLSRPEPTDGFYISKSWCKTALKWLQVQEEEKKLSASNNITSKNKGKKLSKKKQRMRNRRLSDATPPWPNATSDLLCHHQNLQHCRSTRSARAKHRLMDKQAWKVLNKLYPDSVSLESDNGECIICRAEEASIKEDERNLKEQEREKRRKPLSCPIVRGIYTRTRGVPVKSLEDGGPLKPGLYCLLPRVWLHQWRRYMKTGEGELPCAPDASCLLCDGHRLPLIPHHLESYLHGKTTQLLVSTDASFQIETEVHSAFAPLPVGVNPLDNETRDALRAAGVSQQELDAQNALYVSLPPAPVATRTQSKTNKELLDLENKIVVEILTVEEHTALEKWWPHSNFVLQFSVEGPGQIRWSTLPCRECDASGKPYSLSVRNRTRKTVSRTASSRIAEY